MKGHLDLGVSLYSCTSEEARACKAVYRPSILFCRKRCFSTTYRSALGKSVTLSTITTIGNTLYHTLLASLCALDISMGVAELNNIDIDSRSTMCVLHNAISACQTKLSHGGCESACFGSAAELKAAKRWYLLDFSVQQNARRIRPPPSARRRLRKT